MISITGGCVIVTSFISCVESHGKGYPSWDLILWTFNARKIPGMRHYLGASIENKTTMSTFSTTWRLSTEKFPLRWTICHDLWTWPWTISYRRWKEMERNHPCWDRRIIIVWAIGISVISQNGTLCPRNWVNFKLAVIGTRRYAMGKSEISKLYDN